MALRIISKTVSFDRPFVLPGLEGVQPAGTYTVETDEELLLTVFQTAYRRVATWFRVPARSGGGRTQVASIDPVELEAALARDGTEGWHRALAGTLDELLADTAMEQTVRSAGLTPSDFKAQLRGLAPA